MPGSVSRSALARPAPKTCSPASPDRRLLRVTDPRGGTSPHWIALQNPYDQNSVFEKGNQITLTTLQKLLRNDFSAYLDTLCPPETVPKNRGFCSAIVCGDVPPGPQFLIQQWAQGPAHTTSMESNRGCRDLIRENPDCRDSTIVCAGISMNQADS